MTAVPNDVEVRITATGLPVWDRADGMAVVAATHPHRGGQVVLVEDKAAACPWCDGTGRYASGLPSTTGWKRCAYCDATGKKRCPSARP